MDILEKLIGFNTINDQDNLLIMDYIGYLLKEKGFIVEYVYNKNKTRKCLIAKYRNPNLLFMGHTDTVNYQDWTYNPFKLTKVNNKLYGLGSCDMKGGIAAFLQSILEVNLEELSRGIQIVLTYDEEISFSGINLVKDLQYDWPNNVIVGEPTSLIPVTNTKGCMEYKTIFKGISAHSSKMVYGRNAILISLSFIKELLLFSEGLKKTINPLFDTPYTTMNIAKINGGRAINIVPDTCELFFDFRTIQKEQHQVIQNKLQELKEKYHIDITEITNIYPLENNNNVSFYEKITNHSKKSFNFVTEASFLNKDNTIILGVGPNTEHQKDEYIDTSSFNETINVYKKIINHYCK